MKTRSRVRPQAGRRTLHSAGAIALVVVALLLVFALPSPALAVELPTPSAITVPYDSGYGSWGDQGAPGTVLVNTVNTWGVAFPPASALKFVTSRAYTITSITNWHTDTPFLGGTISLLDANGATLGSWPADWTVYRFWKYVRPNLTIGPGTYTVVDSSNSTWVYNSTSFYMGFTRILGVPVNGAPVITSDGGGSTADVYVSPGATFITDVDATDPDPEDTLTYRILGSRFSPSLRMFAINPRTGVLSLVPTVARWKALGGLPTPFLLGKVTVEVRDSSRPAHTDTQVINVWLTLDDA